MRGQGVRRSATRDPHEFFGYGEPNPFEAAELPQELACRDRSDAGQVDQFGP